MDGYSFQLDLTNSQLICYIISKENLLPATTGLDNIAGFAARSLKSKA